MAKRRTGGKNGRMTPRVTPRSVVQSGAGEGVEIDQDAVEQHGETIVYVYAVFYFVPAPKGKPHEFGFGRQFMQSAFEVKTLPQFVAFELFCKESIQQDLPGAQKRSVPVLTSAPHFLGAMTLDELKAIRIAGDQA